MKFKDLRSISTLLKEYGMTPGPATSVGQQNTGSITNKRTQSPSLKVSQSPTTQKQKSQAPKLNVAKAGELKKDFQFPDDKGNVLKVVSPAGEKTSIPNDNEDLVVAMNSKNEPVVFDKDADIAFPEMEEGKLGSFVKKARNKSLGKLKKTGGLRKLGRRGLKENPSELFEINFNNKDVIQNSLDARINCGFEAETVWPNVDHASDDPDNLSFSELVDAYEEASYNEDYIWEVHSDWVREKAYDEFLPDIVDNWVEDNLDDYDLRMEFANDNIDDQEIEDLRDEFKAENPDEYKNRIEDGWDMDNWTSELIDLNYEDDFKEWLNDVGREDDTLIEQAIDEAESEWDMDYWCNEVYGSPAGAFREITDVYFDTERKDVDGIAEVLYEWIRDNSKFTDYPETGSYGDTDGIDIWAVEHDGSITGSGAHGEIISPVYSSPRLMLEEMKSLFEFMQKEGVVTNSSTGLHVTMSWAGDKDIKTNKIKAIVLSGIDHVVSMFGRKGNSYTKLRMPDLKRAMEKLKDGSESQKSIEQIEDILSNAINTDRTMAINFKGIKDPVNKNSLLEFRAAGGRDYHEKISDVVKTVVRYSATMVGSHTEEYNRDYVRALIKTINTIDEMSVDDIERSKQGTSNDNHPLVLLFQSMLGKHDFLDGMREIYVALDSLDKFNKLSEPDAEKKWKSKWDKFKKHSGKGLEDYAKNESIEVVKEAPNSGVEDAGSIPAMIRPSLQSPTEEAKDALRKAQKFFKIAMGRLSHDVAVNLNRSYINAKNISVLRKAIKDFQLSEDELANAIVAPSVLQQINFTNPDAREDNKLKYKLLSKGIHRLLKREKLVKDRYFLTPQMADRLIDGLWNYMHSGKATESSTKKILNLLALARQGEDQEESQDFVNAVYDRIKDKREYSEFFYELENGRNIRGAGLLEPNSVFNKEPLDKLLGFLKKFPEYSYPVSPKHNVNIYSDDDYTENFLKQLSIKVRRRLNHIRTLKDDNLALYFDIVEKLGKLITNTYKDLSAIDVKLGDEFPNLVGTDLENENDGKNFLGLYFGNGYMQDRMQKMLDKFATRNYATDEDGDDVVAEFNRFYDSIRDLLNSYSRSKKDNPKLYAFSPIPELIKSRMGTIKKFLKGIDKISVEDMDFNNTDNIIKAKADISKQEKEWKKKHGPKFVYEIDDFDFGGDVWIHKDIVNDIIGGNEKTVIKTVAEYFEFDRSKYVAQYGLVRRIPNSHYFIAQEAQQIYDNPDMNLSWRKPVARKILEEFNRLYKTSFKSLDKDNVTLQWNEGEIIKTLKKLNVGFTKDLGDGREGMKGLGDKPILPREEINGPYGEPFERSSASAWRANNPELVKKAEAEAEKLKKNMSSGKDEGIIVAAGVEGMGQSSSNEIANNTNWLVLSNHLDIKSGVDQQGANLLKKVYNMYDSNHNWRPDEDPDACCMPRYIAAVKAAKEYIEKNYIESGGNYFRKHADGSIGDDVSAVHRTPQHSLGEIDSIKLGINDYYLTREKYDMFDVMMQSGIQDYIVSADTNRLVKFLKGDFSEKYKQAVIKALIQNKEGGGEPADIQQALALGRNNMESVFAKFNKLTLEEQLLLVEQSEVLEKWSKKQKKSVDCGNPKGFSQKAHCAGRKARQAGKQTKSKSVSEGAVPDNSVVRIVNKLLAEPMPAGDLRKQMDAYFAIPDPKMLTDFRQRRAEGGDDACLRPVLRHYVKAQLNPSLQKSINLNENIIKENLEIKDKERLDYIVNTLKNNPEFIKKVFRYIKVDPDHDGKIDPEELLSKEKTAPETDHLATKEILKAFIQALMNTPGDLDDLESFLWTYGKVNYIDTKKLMSGKSNWSEWLLGSQDVSKEFIEDLYINLFNFTPNVLNSDRGPGEIGLALLSPNIKIASVGDLSIDGVEVEVKGERSVGGGRLRNSNADFGVPQMDKIFNKYNVPQELRNTNVTGNAAPQKTSFLDIAKQLEEFKPGVGKEYIKELINGIYIHADQNLKDQLVNKSLRLDYAENFLEISKIAFNNYANILKGKGFEDILMINLPYKNSLAFKASDINQYIDQFKFSSLDFGDTRNGGAIQVSMKK